MTQKCLSNPQAWSAYWGVQPVCLSGSAAELHLALSLAVQQSHWRHWSCSSGCSMRLHKLCCLFIWCNLTMFYLLHIFHCQVLGEFALTHDEVLERKRLLLESMQSVSAVIPASVLKCGIRSIAWVLINTLGFSYAVFVTTFYGLFQSAACRPTFLTEEHFTEFQQRGEESKGDLTPAPHEKLNIKKWNWCLGCVTLVRSNTRSLTSQGVLTEDNNPHATKTKKSHKKCKTWAPVAGSSDSKCQTAKSFHSYWNLSYSFWQEGASK